MIKLQLKVVEHADCVNQYKNVGTRGRLDVELLVCAGSADPVKIIDTCEVNINVSFSGIIGQIRTLDCMNHLLYLRCLTCRDFKRYV